MKPICPEGPRDAGVPIEMLEIAAQLRHRPQINNTAQSLSRRILIHRVAQ